EAHLGDADEAARARDAVAGRGERITHGVEQAEEHERRQHREQREQGAGLAPEERRPDEIEVFHDAARAASGAAAASTRVPLSRCRVWLAYSAALGSCVTMMMVLP